MGSRTSRQAGHPSSPCAPRRDSDFCRGTHSACSACGPPAPRPPCPPRRLTLTFRLDCLLNPGPLSLLVPPWGTCGAGFRPFPRCCSTSRTASEVEKKERILLLSWKDNKNLDYYRSSLFWDHRRNYIIAMYKYTLQ